MLSTPTPLTPFKSIAPYRAVVLTIGSPIVFHTAPPQPASNAPITCPAVFAGGPLASQNGLGDSRPQNFTRRSAIAHLTKHLQPQMNTDEHRYETQLQDTNLLYSSSPQQTNLRYWSFGRPKFS